MTRGLKLALGFNNGHNCLCKHFSSLDSSTPFVSIYAWFIHPHSLLRCSNFEYDVCSNNEHIALRPENLTTGFLMRPVVAQLPSRIAQCILVWVSHR